MVVDVVCPLPVLVLCIALPAQKMRQVLTEFVLCVVQQILLVHHLLVNLLLVGRMVMEVSKSRSDRAGSVWHL